VGRRIGDARVLLSGAHPAAKLSASSQWLVGGDRPDEARQLAGHAGGDLVGVLAARAHALPALVEAQLRLLGAGHDAGRLTGLAARQMRGASRPATLVVGRLDQQSAGVVVAGLGDRALPAALTRGALRGHEAQVGHECGRSLETGEVADLGDQPDGGQRVDAA